MQDLQNVHLESRESAERNSELKRAALENDLRRRKNHAGSGDGVRFSSIFAMVDNSLELGSDSLKRIPKRADPRDSDAGKNADFAGPAAVDPKSQAAESAKETAKSRVEPEQKPKPPKETARKADAHENLIVHAAALQVKADPQARPTVRPAERAEIKIERREGTLAEKSRAPQREIRRSDDKDRPTESAAGRRETQAPERGPAVQQERGPERKARKKEKDDAPVAAKEAPKAPESQKGPRPEDAEARTPKVRERAEERPNGPERTDGREQRPTFRRSDENDISILKDSHEAYDAGRKKRSIGDLEKLTGLQARSAVELAPPLVPILPAPEIALKAMQDTGGRGGAVDAVRAPARMTAAAGNAGAQQHAGGGHAESQSARAQDKLAQSARRLASYLSGRPETVVKPEATFSDMVAKAKLFVDQGRSEMTLQLKPEQLGSLNIKIVVEDGKMQAQFVTDRPEVRDMIERNEGLLKDKMAEVGIEISSLSVEVRSDAGRPQPRDGQSGGLRRVVEFGSGDEPELPMDSSGAQVAYALAGMGLHLSLVA
ncbi:MAG: hypothetical protein A3G34_14985 [Candidatus Lindowbacteria bacterium RIFCSPLOWO2_12_FULL_62_27]|nr:MAG: hypothetical protein A3I06_10270 [Candidatus Lindowbacteria bacterium RIFCSPLOWO2_02_FULL_62_12]OGH63159.1 MAG: hypothetical protein A3G34_14985 [Candidatus Lindowbacteria bacterium RIFCSPLOWO2_12_FULL_62_27]